MPCNATEEVEAVPLSQVVPKNNGRNGVLWCLAMPAEKMVYVRKVAGGCVLAGGRRAGNPVWGMVPPAWQNPGVCAQWCVRTRACGAKTGCMWPAGACRQTNARQVNCSTLPVQVGSQWQKRESAC